MSASVSLKELRAQKAELEHKIDQMSASIHAEFGNPAAAADPWEAYWMSLLDAYEAICDELDGDVA